ncbi:hypothetical protein Naga_103481g1 [Nannochloropsis gaditana]|uniref:Uncharacterized protein n=1 Tax=Nannochloropsis gaditana TaxID=72520 RepID=W7T177_9STRA|nr:hypothetical protein Naga_103481g1 [Nannochloropsis gaditana]
MSRGFRRRFHVFFPPATRESECTRGLTRNRDTRCKAILHGQNGHTHPVMQYFFGCLKIKMGEGPAGGQQKGMVEAPMGNLSHAPLWYENQ